MTTDTVSRAVQQRGDTAEALVRRYGDRFGDVLPAHIQTETFVGLAVGALHRNPELAAAANANKGSFLNALLDCARLGHEPGTPNYYLVPFGQGERAEVVGIEGYRGQVERMYRAGGVATVHAELVYANDKFTYRLGVDDRPIHEVDWFGGDRGKLLGVYAYATLTGGQTSKVVVMDERAINDRRDKSASAKAKQSPWQQWPDEMALKTAVRQLEKWVPTSSEYRREQLRAVMEARRLAEQEGSAPMGPAQVDESTGEVLEGEVVGQAEEDSDAVE